MTIMMRNGGASLSGAAHLYLSAISSTETTFERSRNAGGID